MKSSTQKGKLIFLIRKWLDIILLMAVVGEIIFFPSLPNISGCVMTVIVWLIFRVFFLKREIILSHPFSFLMFLSMFLYRFIPLTATLIEGKPISYGFEVPYETFFFETLLFIVSSLSFAAAIYSRKRGVNFIQHSLFRLNFYYTNSITLWVLGFIGLAVRLQQLSVAGNVEYGDVSNKFLAGFIYLQYAPIIMLFPTLCNLNPNKQRNLFTWIYTAIIFVISFATNSRESLIYPLFTIILLFFIFILKHNYSIYYFISPIKIIIAFIILFFGLSFISDISLAMLSNRSLRSDINRKDLFRNTVETLNDDQKMEKLREYSLEENSLIISYKEGWDERYLNNFMMNRYGNLRISDQTIYYANIIGWNNKNMQENFTKRIITILPIPILNFLGYNISKKDLEYSPGDLIHSLAGGINSFLGGYRVTSHVGDGLATFGWYYFVIQFFLFYIVFKLLDTLVISKKNKTIYSIIGLINIFGYMGMFRNAGGCSGELNFILRGFWQQMLTYWIIVYIIHFITFNVRKR